VIQDLQLSKAWQHLRSVSWLSFVSPRVNLETHISDVVNLIRWEELSHVVVCGHSYGGCIISGVADRVPDQISALVYLDAFVLEDDESLYDASNRHGRALEGAPGRPLKSSASAPTMRHG